MNEDRKLREHLLEVLRGGGAHLGFEEIIVGWPAKLRGVKPAGAEHTAWQLVEHLRIAQRDILEFSRNAKHVSPKFPAGYWPKTAVPPKPDSWKKSVAAFRADLHAMQNLVIDAKAGLFARVYHPEARAKHTLAREALLLADHNAYHLGQLLLLRRMLGDWKKS